MMQKTTMTAAMVAAMLLSGCGRASMTQVARPTSTPAQAVIPSVAPLTEAADEAPLTETLPELVASPTPTPTPTPTPAAEDDAEKEADETADEEEEETEEEAEEAPQVSGNAYVKEIGKGSLNSANGLAVLADKIYVVDNARTGLFGKFAAVRVYEAASGDYTKLSFENLGLGGAKNLPTAVDRVKLAGTSIVAASATMTYTYDAEAKLQDSAEGTFALVTSAVDPKSGDTFKVAGDHIERFHGATKVVSFGEDQIGEAVSLAFGSDGALYVSDKGKKVVHHFAAAAN